MTVNQAAQCATNRYFPLSVLIEAEARLRSAGLKTLAGRLSRRIATIEDSNRREAERNFVASLPEAAPEAV